MFLDPLHDLRGAVGQLGHVSPLFKQNPIVMRFQQTEKVEQEQRIFLY